MIQRVIAFVAIPVADIGAPQEKQTLLVRLEELKMGGKPIPEIGTAEVNSGRAKTPLRVLRGLNRN